MDFISIPAGSFTMGSPEKEKGRGDDEKQVPVTITQAFELGKTVVTQKQWTEVMETTPWRDLEEALCYYSFVAEDEAYEAAGNGDGDEDEDEDPPTQDDEARIVKTVLDRYEGDNYSAVFVSWLDATKFCKKLTALEHKSGKLSANQKYRLPTEAEWEYACRAGTTTAYSFGDDESSLGDYAWYLRSDDTLHEVATKKPNPWGLFDMHGNVDEWCEDWHEGSLSGGNDPKGPSAGSTRVVRGGGFNYRSASFCRSAGRFKCDPSCRGNCGSGFRIVRVLL